MCLREGCTEICAPFVLSKCWVPRVGICQLHNGEGKGLPSLCSWRKALQTQHTLITSFAQMATPAFAPWPASINSLMSNRKGSWLWSFFIYMNGEGPSDDNHLLPFLSWMPVLPRIRLTIKITVCLHTEGMSGICLKIILEWRAGGNGGETRLALSW